MACWSECSHSGFYCPEFCCQPSDGGNPSCWDPFGRYSFQKCCGNVTWDAHDGHDMVLPIGDLLLPLYRGPSEHNSPRFNERTVEVALGLWFMRESHSRRAPVVEIGNVLANYWPERGNVFPWHLVDLTAHRDATEVRFGEAHVLSISTIEHVGHDNEGLAHTNGFRSDGSLESLTAWVKSWDQAVQLLKEILSSPRLLVTWPLGLNLRLDQALHTGLLDSQLATANASKLLLRRLDAANRWALSEFSEDLEFYYDLRDAYLPDTIHLMFHPQLSEIYFKVYGQRLPKRLRPPYHPKFRFANAICVVTNAPELLSKSARPSIQRPRRDINI